MNQNVTLTFNFKGQGHIAISTFGSWVDFHMHTNTISHGKQNVTLTGQSKITEYFLLGPILRYTLPIYIMELC